MEDRAIEVACSSYIVNFLKVRIDRLLVGDPDVHAQIGLQQRISKIAFHFSCPPGP